MKLALVTDAWQPQVNGVVTTLVELVRELEARDHCVEVIHPGLFKTRPCPGYAGIDLAVRPARQLRARLEACQPDAIHIATEGPLGWAARRYCLQQDLQFTTAFHTRFPEILNAALKIPLAWGYALFRHFHRPSAGVMVPTEGVLHMLQRRGFRTLRSWTHGVDTRLFAFQAQPRLYPPLGTLPRPISLFVGRVSYEKNIEAFLKLDLPGTKLVCGVGPLKAALKARFPQVRWMGLLPREELARVYAAADVFVFPSRSETFGLVMLEAMASGTPVAAYPVDGPLEVLSPPPGSAAGGVMRDDLGSAVALALAVPRHEARQRALAFSWASAAQLFESFLVVARPCDEVCPADGGGSAAARKAVTPLS
ncbi:MAG: glycosyltransferase family 1 protein [Polaromonas sp.]|nr:glycosyltransferase family 1 protein [Polaromonas sp.]